MEIETGRGGTIATALGERREVRDVRGDSLLGASLRTLWGLAPGRGLGARAVLGCQGDKMPWFSRHSRRSLGGTTHVLHPNFWKDLSAQDFL